MSSLASGDDARSLAGRRASSVAAVTDVSGLECPYALAEAAMAPVRVEDRVHGRGRLFPLVRGQNEDDVIPVGQLERREHAAVATTQLGPVVEEERDVGADPCRDRGDSPTGSGSGSSSLASESAAAASELPPPRPAATGIAFSISTCQPGSPSTASASARSADATIVSPSYPRTTELLGRLEPDPVGEREALQHGGDLVLAVGSEWADH